MNNRYVPEAVAYLAMADTMDGNGGPGARGAGEGGGLLKQPRPELRLALGRVYWQQARPGQGAGPVRGGHEGPAGLRGRRARWGGCCWRAGLPDLALKPLTQAVERNGFHGEARDALGRALLALGRTAGGLQAVRGVEEGQPGEPRAHKGFALALLPVGQSPGGGGGASAAR